MKKISLFVLSAVLLVSLAACGPSLRIQNDTGSAFSSSGLTSIKFDNATWGLVELNMIPEGGASWYKIVKEGATHDIVIEGVPVGTAINAGTYSDADIGISLAKGKKYTFYVGGDNDGAIEASK